MLHKDFLGATLDFKFCTVAPSTGAPTTLSGTPAVSVYPDNSTTQITAGVTLTTDFDTVTGLNNVRIVATSGNGYDYGTKYYLVITTGTVDSVSAVGYVVGEFYLYPAQAPEFAIVDYGTAQSATGTTLVLRSAAAFADDELIGATVHITGGSAGVGQSRIITDYANSTDTATVDTWTTTPTGTIEYVVYASPAPSTSSPAPSNITQISGDSTAADNLEAALDGTGSVTISANLDGSVGSVTGAINTTSGTITTLDGLDTAQDSQHSTTQSAVSTVDGNVDTMVLGIITGQAQTGTLSTTQATSDLTGYADDQLIGRIITWTSGACEGEQTDITDYANASGLLTFTALTTAPSNGDTFKVT